jgi:hypothetical protein
MDEAAPQAAGSISGGDVDRRLLGDAGETGR